MSYLKIKRMIKEGNTYRAEIEFPERIPPIAFKGEPFSEKASKDFIESAVGALYQLKIEGHTDIDLPLLNHFLSSKKGKKL
jgi:hypothetical protein